MDIGQVGFMENYEKQINLKYGCLEEVNERRKDKKTSKYNYRCLKGKVPDCLIVCFAHGTPESKTQPNAISL